MEGVRLLILILVNVSLIHRVNHNTSERRDVTMNRWIYYFLLSFTLLTHAPIHSASISLPDTLVTAEWLNNHLDDPELVVLDTSVVINFDEHGNFTISSGRAQYNRQHIPGARFADLTKDLVDVTSEYPYAVPAPEKFAAAMQTLGVGDDKTVVLYAGNYSAWAARVWWMLRWIGFDNVAILDGGLNTWNASGYPVSSDPPRINETVLSVSLRPELIVGQNAVLEAIEDSSVTLIDAMPAAHYRGEMVMYGRAGHIPTAINIPNVFDDNGHFLSDDVLEEMHTIDREKRVIIYCDGGISVSANAFAMHRLGFTNLAVYTNSLDEWAANSENPLIVNDK